jgi:hypothetical protein
MKNFIKVISVSTIILFIIVYTFSCKSEQKTGEQLARTYCSACHLFPNPELLDKNSWKNGVLPSMSIRMGVTLIEQSPKYSFAEIQQINDLHVLPERPMISASEWQLIEKYYLENAPEKLDTTSKNLVAYQSLEQQFTIKPYPVAGDEITLLKYDTTLQKLITGTRKGEIFVVEPKSGKVLQQSRMYSSPTDISFQKDSTFYLSVAGKLEPNHDKNGICALAHFGKDKIIPQKVIRQLPRPVDIAVADLNQDNKQDVLVCSFGYFAGKLAWYEINKDSVVTEHLLKNEAGATCVLVSDMNQDKLPDVVALMGQGNEGVFIFYNKGNGVFEEEQVLKFPSVYGSLHIELIDFNKDGFKDIVYTNGDNGDETPVLKPYHGIRIFLNNGKNQFTEKYFFPMYGAMKSLVRDFDKDGDLDIATFSFFPDYSKSPQKSFVYLQNNGNYFFKPFISPQTDSGHWMVMDAFDFDKDGDEDIILGSCYDIVREKNALVKLSQTPLLLLENKTKKPL